MTNLSDTQLPFQCPKCGSGNIDHPRRYGPNMRLMDCTTMCMDCGYEKSFPTVQQAFDAGLGIIVLPKRGTDCPASHDGHHHVDTSMESGPNNCFHCERPM